MTQEINHDWITEEHLVFMDNLRESGVTNMFGAAPFAEDEFDLDHNEASDLLKYWMESFGTRHE